MQGLSLEDENIIKDIRNLFRQKNETALQWKIWEICLEKKKKLKQLKIIY